MFQVYYLSSSCAPGLMTPRSIGLKLTTCLHHLLFVLYATMMLFKVSTTTSYIYHCSHLADARSSLLSSVSVALVPASTAYQNFFCGSDSVKTRILLGAPSDDPSADRRIDIAFRRFFVRVHSLRRRHIQASYSIS